MSTQSNNTLDRIKYEVANRYLFNTYAEAIHDGDFVTIVKVNDEVCERYAEEKAKPSEDLKAQGVAYVRSIPGYPNFSMVLESHEIPDTAGVELYNAFIAGATGRFTRSEVEASIAASLERARHNVFLNNDHVDKKVIDSIMDPSNHVIV